ncbi:tetratricopeptide TPR_2 repeat protein [Kribbella flavida DSM 17836]|uniref:Tetratricopeptide TPR_2 repeat protein n=1 Tax=Kribbella flavida (strain DSM 17836 / JCM 10339 / NBRC 14399) TaxID=479435 RepID=D2PTA8_KRIFD|nr:tetratricopeptide repeat protein [Kribbella flavida]ADB29424.1 tetratricopeptide TPR_2 repeat protein [Kribbella flavida DSM 17836]
MEDMRALSYGLGRQYFEEKDYRGAIRALRPVVEETPDDVGTRLLLARAYYHSALLKPAEEHLHEVLTREPTEYYAHLMMARTLERQSRHDEAVKHRRIAAALTGNDELLQPHRV